MTASHRRGPRLGTGPRIERECILCGGHEQTLVFPANAHGEIPIEEFACTTDGLAFHDDIIQCRRCGMVSAVPSIGSEAIVDGYQSVVDEGYLIEEEGRRELFTWIAREINGYVQRGRRLLEIGANVGLFLDVARGLGWEVRGVEPSKWAVEQGVAQFGVPLRRGIVEELDEPPRSADVVVMLDVLEHLVDPLDTLRRLREVIDDEGLLVLSTVNLSGVHRRIRGERWPWFIRSHLHYFTPETLAAMLSEAGYRMVQWESVPRSFHLSYVAQRAGKSLGPIGPAAAAISKAVDPRVPLGWLGDICLVAARPRA